MKRLYRSAALLAATLAAAAETLAAPITITGCATIAKPGSYLLDRNATGVGDCIKILSDFVTLDLGGHMVIGNGSGTGVSAPPGSPVKGVTVRNGTVTNFVRGVFFGATSIVVIERMQVIGNDVGIMVGHGIVRDNVVARHTSYSIHIDDHALVTGNLVIEGGMGVRSWRPGTVSGNVFASNLWGISLLGWGGGHTVSGNTVYGGSVGIEGIWMACPSLVLGNTSTSNSANMVLLSAPLCTVDHNAAP